MSPSKLSPLNAKNIGPDNPIIFETVRCSLHISVITDGQLEQITGMPVFKMDEEKKVMT